MITSYRVTCWVVMMMVTLCTAHAKTSTLPPGPLSTINAAIANASAWDTIVLSRGTFTDCSTPIVLDKLVTILGEDQGTI